MTPSTASDSAPARRWLGLPRWLVVLIVLLLLAVAGFFFARHLAVEGLRAQILQALGPESEVGEIVVGWSAVEVRDLRIRAPEGKGAWPAREQLRAARVVVVPSVRDLLSARIRIQRVRIEDAYLSVLRTREGRLRLLPTLLERKSAGGGAAPEVSIDRIELDRGALEFFDASVRQPAHRIRLEGLDVELQDLHLPRLESRMALEASGTVKGVRQDGRLKLKGWLEIAAKNSELKTTLSGVDLIAFQPYLIKASETGVRRGTLDLDLQSSVRGNRLHAPGTVTLSHLELAPASGAFATFMGMPRQAVVNSMKDDKDRIVIRFTLDGNLSDPHFSLNENLALRTGAAMAELLGISVETVTKSVGKAAEGVGDVIRKVFQ